VQEHPAMAGNTCAAETSETIPFWLHGDEIHYAVKGKSLVLSWGSRVGAAKSPWLSRFIFCIVPCDIMVKTVTLNQLLYYFSLSCKILLKGVMPSRPLVGGGIFITGSFQHTSAKQPCCGRFRFAFSDLKGDMVFLVQALGWRSFSAVSCCPTCFGSKTHRLLNYKNCRFDAPWRLTLESHEEWLLNMHDAIFRSPLLDIPGARKERFMNDFMHTGHLGMYPHLCGSVLIDLVDDGAFEGRNRQDCLIEAWRLFKRWCTDHGINCSMDRFTLERLGLKSNKKSRTKWACLKTKAMNSRVCIAWLDHFCTYRVNANASCSEYMRLMTSTLHNLATFQYYLDVMPEFLDEQQRHLVWDAGYQFLFGYCHLAKENSVLLRARYNFVPKFHAFCHLLDLIMEQGINIRYYQCYADEDYIGKVGRIAASSHRLAMPVRTVQRLSVLTSLEL
jgi:hypothetical protein